MGSSPLFGIYIFVVIFANIMIVHQTNITKIRYIAFMTTTNIYVVFFPNVEQNVSNDDKIEIQKKFREHKKEFIFKTKSGYDNIPDNELEDN
jgi:hypothetical protein